MKKYRLSFGYLATTLLLVCSCQPQQKNSAPLIERPQKSAQEAPTADTWPKDSHFVIKVQTNHDDGTVTINAQGEGHRYVVDWDNDGTFDTQELTGPAHHSYGSRGEYTIRIAGKLPHVMLCSKSVQTDLKPSYDKDKQQDLVDVIQWGDIRWKSMAHMFANCKHIQTLSAQDQPNLSKTSDMSYMFRGAHKFNSPLEQWNVSHVKTMAHMFAVARQFNQPLEQWDVSNVTDMQHMFEMTTSFNQPLDKWDVSHVTTMANMFLRAHAFNQPLERWTTTHVENMRGMFHQTYAFNQPLDRWDVSHVKDMSLMFYEAQRFDHSLGSWDIRNVEHMEGMLERTRKFSTQSYDATLKGWASHPSPPSHITLGARGLYYCAAEAARNTLINSYTWEISDSHKACTPGERTPEHYITID